MGWIWKYPKYSTQAKIGMGKGREKKRHVNCILCFWRQRRKQNKSMQKRKSKRCPEVTTPPFIPLLSHLCSYFLTRERGFWLFNPTKTPFYFGFCFKKKSSKQQTKESSKNGTISRFEQSKKLVKIKRGGVQKHYPQKRPHWFGQ